jgi:methanogenic corrinoid protein MtbC1
VAALDGLRLALIELDENRTLALVPELLEKGASPLSILNTCQQALKVVGERYERQEYYISGLIMAGELFKEVLALVQPLYEESPGGGTAGTIVLGTVAQDIHDIGKNLFATTLRGFDFKVIDLGVDVMPQTFLEEVRRSKPDVVCLSGLILAAFDSMKATVTLLREREVELGYHPPVILGGGIIDGAVCRHAGADSWSTDAMEGMRICQDLVARARS